jgi:predicted membrane protein
MDLNQDAGFIELSINSESHSIEDIIGSILIAILIVIIIYYYFPSKEEIIIE